MLELISRLFVQKPLVLASIAGFFLAAYFAARVNQFAGRSKVFLWIAIGWAAWAIWEFAVLRTTPDANIRVDLLLIIPVVLGVTLVGTALALWPRR